MRDVLPVVRRASSMATGRGSDTVTIATRIAVAGVFGVALLAVLFLRLWALTVIGGDHYQQLSVRNQVRQVPIEAPRGSIVDRKGRPLVTNRAARQVVVDLRDVPDARRPQLVRDLAAQYSCEPAIIDRLSQTRELTSTEVLADFSEDFGGEIAKWLNPQ
jgi:cell division protein FtsI/penicillin-binding protein 2